MPKQPEDDDKYFDQDMNVWRCGTCNFILRSDGECTTRECFARNEFKKLGIEPNG